MSDTPVALIVAVADNGVIGARGGLPWHISSDLKMFRRLTMNKPLIMGRRTFQSLKKPLDGRDNIVVTRDKNFRPPGALIAGGFEMALTLARRCAETRGIGSDEIMVIGGTQIFDAALPTADRIYKTEVHGRPDGDVFFPALEPAEWQEVERSPLPKGPRDDFATTFVVLERVRQDSDPPLQAA
jgi:dihydrofolate reductase